MDARVHLHCPGSKLLPVLAATCTLYSVLKASAWKKCFRLLFRESPNIAKSISVISHRLSGELSVQMTKANLANAPFRKCFFEQIAFLFVSTKTLRRGYIGSILLIGFWFGVQILVFRFWCSDSGVQILDLRLWCWDSGSQTLNLRLRTSACPPSLHWRSFNSSTFSARLRHLIGCSKLAASMFSSTTVEPTNLRMVHCRGNWQTFVAMIRIIVVEDELKLDLHFEVIAQTMSAWLCSGRL